MCQLQSFDIESASCYSCDTEEIKQDRRCKCLHARSHNYAATFETEQESVVERQIFEIQVKHVEVDYTTNHGDAHLNIFLPMRFPRLHKLQCAFNEYTALPAQVPETYLSPAAVSCTAFFESLNAALCCLRHIQKTSVYGSDLEIREELYMSAHMSVCQECSVAHNTYGSSPCAPYDSVSSGYLSNRLASPAPPRTGGTYGASMSFLANLSHVTSANHGCVMTSLDPPCKFPSRLVRSEELAQ